MASVRTRTFRSGNSEAVRLPREVAFGQTGLELTITRTGDMLTLYPATKGSGKALADALTSLPGPVLPETRDAVEPPERICD